MLILSRADLAGALQMREVRSHWRDREAAMNANRDYEKSNPAPKEVASYFGLTVEIIFRMRNYSLIRRCDRESVVDTADLQPVAERRAA
jgi:hypothetical protein